jgi:hypothetical protein
MGDKGIHLKEIPSSPRKTVSHDDPVEPRRCDMTRNRPSNHFTTDRMLSSAEKSDDNQEKNILAREAPANAVTFGKTQKNLEVRVIKTMEETWTLVFR